MTTKIGANYHKDGWSEFILWGPHLSQVDLKMVTSNERIIAMECDDRGYWRTHLKIEPDTLYFYQINQEKSFPDPASHYQPYGVHKASQVIDHHHFQWQDRDWCNLPLDELIIYELHVGTFTKKGTFTAIIDRLSQLKDLGINAIELMPVAQFPGDRNWGYDGVYPFAVQQSYGGVNGLKELVNACHQQGIAVILDVVYNHFGPEGNYTGNFAPYFSDKYQTPWGNALNFDGAYSYGVRNFFIENALYWLRDYHIDGLRLDAIHGIYDFGAKHFLWELKEEVNQLSKEVNRSFYLIAESDLNDVRIIRPHHLGGYGMDAQWSDDFHHCLHTILTGENKGYYQDFGKSEQLVKAYRESFVYSWNYSPHRQRYHGNFGGDRPPSQFVVYSQNHDQIGNRMLGERLSTLVSFDALKLAAGSIIISPYIPMIFMGEEYGEEAPFLYFISHNDPDLVEAVRQGRKAEFKSFNWETEPPDPYDIETFNQCQLNWDKWTQGKYQVLRNFYIKLIKMRRQIPALKDLTRENLEAKNWENTNVISVHRWNKNSQVFCIMNFDSEEIEINLNPPEGNWTKKLDSNEHQWLGKGVNLSQTLSKEQRLKIPEYSFIIYED